MRPALLLTLCLSLPAFAQPIQQAKTPEGYRYGWVGAMPKKPMPTVLFLGGEVENNLSGEHLAKAIDLMCKKVLCLTIDGPGEGADAAGPPVLVHWAQQVGEGKDFVGMFVKRAGTVLSRLIKAGTVDPDRIGVFGTSRGAFVGLHLAAADSRIKAIAAFAPVTDPSVLTEFRQIDKAKKFAAASRAKFADKLYKTPIWLVIGTADDRVGTEEAIEFSQMMIRTAAQKKVSSVFELHVRHADGHRTPPGAYEQGAEWMMERLSKTQKIPSSR